MICACERSTGYTTLRENNVIDQNKFYIVFVLTRMFNVDESPTIAKLMIQSYMYG